MSAALIEAARAALDSWARDECVQFVSRSDGHRTTTTVSRDALLLLVTRALAAAEQPAEPVSVEIASLRAALKWYADGEHFTKAQPDAWDTVSGEPQNWWCDEAGTAMVEDGTLAGMVLAGKLTGEQLNALEDGEVVASPAAPAQAPTDEFVYRVVRSVQPHLDDTCKAWGQEFAQCKYWLDAAHGIGSKA